MKVEVSVRR